MNHHIQSIRTFIGAKDFNESRAFYTAFGFEEVPLGKMSLFKQGNFGFYLQKAYVKDWVNNSMIFLEVENTESHRNAIIKLNLKEELKIKIFSKLCFFKSLIKLRLPIIPLCLFLFL